MISSRFHMSLGSVMLWPIDFGSGGTISRGRSSFPLPIALRRSPMTPNLLVRRGRGALPSSPHVVMPMARSFSSVWDPMPQSFFTGRASRTDGAISSVIQRKPSGFARSLASLAMRTFGPMPAVQVMPSSLFTAPLMARARFSGPPKRWCEPVISRKISSIEYVSVLGLNRRQISWSLTHISAYFRLLPTTRIMSRAEPLRLVDGHPRFDPVAPRLV